MSYIPLYHQGKSKVYKLEDTKASKEYLSELKKILTEYQRINGFQKEIPELKNYQSSDASNLAGLPIVQEKLYQKLISTEDIHEVLDEENFKLLIEQLITIYHIDQVSNVFYRGITSKKYFELKKVPIKTGKSISYNTEMGYITIEKLKSHESFVIAENYYMVLDIIGKKNPTLFNYLDLSGEFSFQLEKLYEYLNIKTNINQVTVPEFELTTLEFMKILCKYFQMLHIREVETMELNPWLQEMGKKNYILLAEEFFPLKKILTKEK